MAATSTTAAALFAVTAVSESVRSYQQTKAKSAASADRANMDKLIKDQEAEAMRQRNELEQNRRDDRARTSAVRTRREKLRNQFTARGRARPRSGTILTSRPFGDSIIGGGQGRSSIIGG